MTGAFRWISRASVIVGPALRSRDPFDPGLVPFPCRRGPIGLPGLCRVPGKAALPGELLYAGIGTR